MKDLAFDHWDDLLYMVLQENDRQLGKWGYQDHDPFRWTVFLMEEVGELAAAIADTEWKRDGVTDGDVASEAIQVATLALKIAEMHLYRKQSEDADEVLVDPTTEELREVLEKAKPGSTITVEETIYRLCDHPSNYHFYQGSPPASREAAGTYCKLCGQRVRRD